MTSGRPPAPPVIPGFTFLRALGSGGYSRVYLYEQHMPRREVAVKVMHDVAVSATSRFEHEANLMAKVSSHPAILSIYGAGVSEGGRPFIVMEYCPPPQLEMRVRRAPLSVGDALDTAIRIAGAVESAHRVGIIHRDIKPANILFTSYQRPVLSDFGISAMRGPAESPDELRGMSVPWAPPEQLVGSRHAEPTTDIYALAATTYAMLAGHSPFEAPGSAESVFDLARRIVKDPVPPLGRPEAPPSLFRVLSIAMDKDPSRRYRTVLAFARALQQVESELGLPITAVDLYSDSLPAAGAVAEDGADDDSAATRIGVFSRVDAQVPSKAGAARSTWSSTGDPARRRWNPVLVGTIATVVVAAAVIGAVLLSQGADEARPRATFATLAPGGSDPLGAVIPQPRTVVGERMGDGTVSFTWLSPQDGWRGTYLYRSDIAGQEDEDLEPTTKPSATIAAQPGSTCIEVYAVQTDGRMSQPVRSCVTTP